MAELLQGLIVKSIGGFYYVETTEHILYECRARGVFRKRGLAPVTGDRVWIEPEENNKATVCKLDQRKNELIRPPLANLDRVFLVTSICDPQPNLPLLDKLVAICEYKEIEPVIIITKSDLQDTAGVEKIYRHAGFTVQSVHYHDADSAAMMKALLRNRVSAFTGNTGVGKSSLLNLICPDWEIKTAQISQKLGRGRHTTRHVELYRLEEINAYVADTPGFSTVDFLRYDRITKEALQYCFREFEPYLGGCQFTGCSHTVEKGCAVLAALDSGKIEPTRHQSYVQLYDEVKNIKDWER